MAARLRPAAESRLARSRRRAIVGEREQHARERDPIGDAVVDSGDHRGAVSVAVDEMEVPERLGAVERIRHQVGNVAPGARRSRPVREGRPGGSEDRGRSSDRPPSTAPSQRGLRDHPLAEAGEPLDQALDRSPLRGRIRRLVEPEHALTTIRFVGWSMCSQAASA